MIQELKSIPAKYWRADYGIYLLLGIILLPACLYSMHMPFALNDDYGQIYAVEHIVISPVNWVDAKTAPMGDQNWYIYYNHLRRKVFTQIFDFYEIKAASPYAEEYRELPFVLMPDDLIEVELLPRAPITKETGAFFILYQLPKWRETLIFHSNVVMDGNFAHIFNIVTCRMEKATLIWRNEGRSGVLPATRIILRVWRQTADRGQIGEGLIYRKRKN